jgi:serine/threonine protein phosphatase PrpC
MSTHRPISRRKGSARLPIFACAGSLLIALQFWLALSSTAFAAPLAPDALTKQTPYPLARAGVSVVRLLVTYQPGTSNAGVSQVICTGLGVIVANWSTKKIDEANTWVLTDSYLVSENGPAPCVEGDNRADMRLQNIQFLTNSFYNSSSSPTVFTADRAGLQIKCPLLGGGCPQVDALVNTPMLLGFSNKPLNAGDDLSLSSLPAEPFVDMVPLTETMQAPSASIVLRQEGSTQVLTPVKTGTDATQLNEYQQTARKYLAPVSQTDEKNLEPGTPLINENGALTSLQIRGLNNSFVSTIIDATVFKASIVNFANSQQNTVRSSWNTGIDAFYAKNGAKKDLTLAQQSFNSAAKTNPTFKAATNFSQIAASENIPLATPTPTPQRMDVASNAALGMELWQIALLGLIVVLVLLALVTILLRRSRARKQQRSSFTVEELAEAERQSTIMAQQLQAMESQQVPPPPAAPPMSIAPQAQMSPMPMSALPTEVHCPNCNTVVPYDANFCPNCRLWLSPSESGLHMRVLPQQPGIGAVAAPPAALPISEQPTMPPPPTPVSANQAALAEQPTLPASVLKGATLAEQPTLEMAPKSSASNLDVERTQPYNRKSNGARLAFVVGTRSDPGIKRQYKPNEDSLFAAQGVIQAPNPQPFGLFVVADGMGGHANGQDASRLAIQTIVEYILPRLVKSGVASSEVYTHLLAEGVQSANQAVHQRNMDQRGDMGTTVTAAMLVESTAYVANVGDSRTYLYRASEGGLSKVTNDHSVVASLVEAGIIKPDDIYTHPKRSHIYRSLGEKAIIEVDSFVVPVQEGDKMLLCSDGLWDMVRDPQIEEVIKAPNEPKMTSEALIQAAYSGGGEDNVSVIVVQVAKASRAPRSARLQVLAMPDSFKMPQM